MHCVSLWQYVSRHSSIKEIIDVTNDVQNVTRVACTKGANVLKLQSEYDKILTRNLSVSIKFT